MGRLRESDHPCAARVKVATTANSNLVDGRLIFQAAKQDEETGAHRIAVSPACFRSLAIPLPLGIKAAGPVIHAGAALLLATVALIAAAVNGPKGKQRVVTIG
jgi:hypothetical protein